MLAGDALQAEAFKVLAEGPLPAAQTASLMRELAQASGTAGMCGGQAIDLAAVGNVSMSFADLERMHRMKTGALLKASVLMGALSGQAPLLTECTREALARFGEAIGLAFQVVDDILDVEASSADLGQDRRQGRRAGQADLRFGARHGGGEGVVAASARPGARGAERTGRAGRPPAGTGRLHGLPDTLN